MNIQHDAKKYFATAWAAGYPLRLCLTCLCLTVMLAACGLRSIEVQPENSQFFLNQKRVSKDELLHQAKKGDVITIRCIGYYDLNYFIGSNRSRNRDLSFRLSPCIFSLRLRITPSDSKLYIDGHPQNYDRPVLITYGQHHIRVAKDGYETVTREPFISADSELLIKLLKEGSRHEFLGQAGTGVWPKQIVFSPDGNYVLVPLLADNGVEIIGMQADTLPGYHAERLTFPRYGKYVGFVEGVFNRRGGRFFVTQMTTGRFHVIRFPEREIERTVETGGSYPKVIAMSPDEKLIAVSNWVSDDISIIDADTLERIRILRFQAQAPRGLAFTPDGNHLLAAYFDTGHLIKISTRTWQAENILHTGGANRHLVIDATARYGYVSNMQYNVVYVLDLKSDKIVQTVKVGINPNTIQLTPDGRYLYVSCRGPNNPQNYELASPEDGNVYVIDTSSFEVVEIIPGGNQPTGLAISPDGGLLVFSNFQDNNIEVYKIKDKGRSEKSYQMLQASVALPSQQDKVICEHGSNTQNTSEPAQ